MEGSKMADIKYEIIERIAILSESGKWTKELNKVSWNNRPAKYDLREWNHDEGRMGKGATLTYEEIKNLREVLNAIEL
jgi:hypothetical protein